MNLDILKYEKPKPKKKNLQKIWSHKKKKWIDFPREGNGDSYHYARRRWDLVDDNLLRYQHLNNWEKEMQKLERKFRWLRKPQYVTLTHESDKLIAFERGGLFWVFNFHPTNSYSDYRFGKDLFHKILCDDKYSHVNGC